MALGPLAATTNGTRGCWTQPGSMRAPLARYHSPSWSVTGWLSSRSMRWQNSANRPARSRAVTGVPSTSASNPVPPAPMPSSSRPSLTSSRPITSLANGTGWRKFGEATQVPSRIRSVTTAAAVSNGTVASHGPSASERQARWS